MEPPLVLGPMAGTTSRAFRLLCRRAGAGLVCSEMASIRAISQGNPRTLGLLRTFPGEHPVSVQLFGSDPALMAEAVARAEAAGADIIDINMGCPVPKVRRADAGVALLSEPHRAVALTAAAVAAASVPVTIKMRAGLVAGDDSYLELARRAQDVGAAAVALHARSAGQAFSGKADWGEIARLVAAVDVPVIGGGDISTPQDAPRMMRETGCAAVMVARGAWGRPWFFGQASAALRGEPIPPDPPPGQRLAVALLHAQMLVLDLDERIAMHQMRMQMHHYVRGLPRARELCGVVARVHTLDELRAVVHQYLAELHTGEVEGAPAPQPTGATCRQGRDQP
ncbi:MAG: tRNA dihydrouridine synthase DusB [Armatimonadota bacterium]